MGLVVSKISNDASALQIAVLQWQLRRKGETDERQKAHRLERHVYSVGHANGGNLAADEIVRGDWPAGQWQAGNGAAIAAVEYLCGACPDASVFSPLVEAVNDPI